MAVSDTYYTAQAATAKAVTQQLNKAWAGLNVTDIDGSWLTIRDQTVEAVVAGQIRSAAASEIFLARVLVEAGVTATAEVSVPAIAYAGYTSAGLPVDTVLDTAPLRVKQSLLGGATLADAMASGLARLLLIGATETQDAGRGAMAVNMGLERRISGYERKVRLPACGRCTILAGRLYKWNQGFSRHPHCDCVHIPVTSGEWSDAEPENTPDQLFSKMSKADQEKAFTKDGAEAIRFGADPGKVVNARRGMTSPGDEFTTAGVRGRQIPTRLSPQGIAQQAGSDRQKLQQLLDENGYLI